MSKKYRKADPADSDFLLDQAQSYRNHGCDLQTLALPKSKLHVYDHGDA
jgi:hypothetical protein